MPKTTYLYACLIFLLFSRCNEQSQKNDFIGLYLMEKMVPLDSNTHEIKNSEDWALSLEPENNFVLTGNRKNIMGYWKVEKGAGNEYGILLQGNGITVTGLLNGKSIFFDKPNEMFDSLFASASFTRSDN